MSDQDKQTSSDGFGPLIERRYWIEFQQPQKSAAEIMGYIQRNIDEFSPKALADFEKAEGSERKLRPGDEFHITILGPWNGDVRVLEVSDSQFKLETLEGHPEAGEITFSIEPVELLDNALHFEIRSLARSRDGLVAVTYDKLGVGKKAQEITWVQFCQRVCEFAGGEAIGDVQVRTLYEEDLDHRTKAEAENQ
ncbi:DUF1990 domain-containing protein [Deinococcus sp. Marseille-Q6407]|uniref:DUF1990 domain-containing protein n=1 Tax=Deinococcus sp. Marseille-Q6407 TaxID=2969223 RepID=UPI0021C16B58|nr:DUF1990 domain-containing protein [Deinococcus sp. Marseille-Q6407]